MKDAFDGIEKEVGAVQVLVNNAGTMTVTVGRSHTKVLGRADCRKLASSSLRRLLMGSDIMNRKDSSRSEPADVAAMGAFLASARFAHG